MKYKRFIRVPRWLLLTLLSLALAGTNAIIVLDSEGNTGWYNSIALSGNTVMVVSYNARFFRLKLAKCDFTGTTCERPQTTVVETNPDWFASLKIDNNVAVISYFETRYRQLILITCHTDPDSFCRDQQFLPIDTAKEVGTYSSLALSGHTVVISYYDALNADLKLATCHLQDLACTSIQTTTVDSAGDVGQFSSLALSGSDAIIAYYDATNFALKLARCNIGGTFCEHPQTATIDIGAETGFGWYTSLALIDPDTAVVSYFDSVHGDLKLATCNLSPVLCKTHQTATVDSEGVVGLFTSIAPYGNKAVISYYDLTNHDLKLAVCPIAEKLCDTPVIVTLDTEGDVGKFTSIVLHGTEALISYQDVTKRNLKLASYTLP